MFLYKKLVPLKVFALWILLSIPQLVQGQGNLSYEGPLQIGKYQGKASFTYDLVAQDTVLNGPFLLQQSNLPELLSAKDQYLSFSGAFEDNTPVGSWRFKIGEFHEVNGTEVVDYHYKVKVSGEQHEAYGNIEAGKPHGKWVQSVHRIEDSEIDETLFESTITFDKGTPQQSFQLQNDNTMLVGRFLREGLAHDVWELYSNEAMEAVESWFFVEGKLVKIVLQGDGAPETFVAYADGIESPQSINLDNRYLETVRLQLMANSQSNSAPEAGMKTLLAQNAAYYKKIDNILTELGKADFMPHFMVKVPNYPLEEEESKKLAEIKAWHQEGAEICQILIENTQLHILKLSDEVVLYQLTALETLYQQYLNRVKQLVSYHEQEMLSFMPRQAFVQVLWPSGLPDTELPVSYEWNDSLVTKSYVGPQADRYNAQANGIDGVHQLTQYLLGSIKALDLDLHERLRKKEYQEALAALEEALIKEVSQLNTTVDSLSTTIEGEAQTATRYVKSAAKQALNKHFNNGGGQAVSSSQLRELISCIKSMRHLAINLASLPANVAQVKELYTDQVWNPFTATVMSEEVKKRLTDAYEELLVPYLLNQAQNDLNCTNAARLNALLTNLHERMIAMREEGTEKIERKLRKERDPQVVLALFDTHVETQSIKP